MAENFHIIDFIKQNNLFFICSDNYRAFDNIFYGYAITNNRFIAGKQSLLDQVDIMDSGAFVQICNDDKQIKIIQNYFCGYGLFLYRKDKFWAVANSLLYLFEKIDKEYNYTINNDFRDLFIAHHSITPSVTETIINEITELAAGQYIVIDKETGSLTVLDESTDFFRFELFSRDALQLLDQWRSRYESLARTLLASNFKLKIDLSGGMDSRAAFSTVINLPLNNRNIRVHSATHHHHYSDDFKIASRIGQIYGFNLNNDLDIKTGHMSDSDAVLKSLYAKMFTTDEIGYSNEYLLQPLFAFTGQGGEVVRQFDAADETAYLERINLPQMGKLNCNEGAKRLLKRVFSYLRSNYGAFCNDGQLLFIYTCAKHYHMRNTVESMFGNSWLISPLFDTCLLKINYVKQDLLGKNFLNTFIYDRYLPELDSLGFDKKRALDPIALKICQQVNKSFPPEKIFPEHEWELCLSKDFVKPLPHIEEAGTGGKNHVIELYNSALFKSDIGRELDPALYNFAGSQYATADFKPEKFINKTFSLWLLDLIKRKAENNGEKLENAGELLTFEAMFAEALKLDNYEPAIELWRLRRQKNPHDLQQLLSGIHFLLKNGQAKQAEIFEKDLTDAFPENLGLLVELAQIHIAHEDSGKAAELLAAAARLDCQAADNARLAQLYLEINDTANAEMHCAIALGKDDSQRDFWDLLLEIAARKNDAELTISACARMDALFPGNVKAAAQTSITNAILPNYAFKRCGAITRKVLNIISTRYFISSEACTPFIKYYLSSQKVIESYLRKRSGLFLQYCYKSVVSQLGDDDLWLLLVDRAYHDFVLSTLPELDPRLCFVTRDEHDAIIQKYADSYDGVLVNTRIDNDDALACDYLATVKNAVFSVNATLGLIVFPHGVQYGINAGLNTQINSSPHFMSAFKFPGTEGIAHVEKYGPHNLIFHTKHHIYEILTTLPMWLEIVHGTNQGNRILAYGEINNPDRLLAQRFNVFLQ